eukprot:6201925-Pleurochrysis_carterae.AAC.7
MQSAVWTPQQLNTSAEATFIGTLGVQVSELDVLIFGQYVGAKSRYYFQDLFETMEARLVTPKPTRLLIGFDSLPASAKASSTRLFGKYKRWVVQYAREQHYRMRAFQQTAVLFRNHWAHQAGVTLMLLQHAHAEYLLLTELDNVFLKVLDIPAVLSDVDYLNTMVTPTTREDLIRVVKFNVQPIALEQGPGTSS